MRRFDIEEQRQYAMFGVNIRLTEEVNGIPKGKEGSVVQVRPGFLGRPWAYAFMAHDWQTTKHPFTLVKNGQFEEYAKC